MVATEIAYLLIHGIFLAGFGEFLRATRIYKSLRQTGIVIMEKTYEFSYCVLGATWNPHENNNGGFIIQYSIKNFGFGEISFVIEKDGSLTCDTETSSREFAQIVLSELLKRATLRDNIKDKEPLVKETYKHGERGKELYLEELDDKSK